MAAAFNALSTKRRVLNHLSNNNNTLYMSQSNPNNISGKAWPAALRRELGLQDSQTKTSDDNTSTSSFTPNQLRQYIHRSYATLSSLQRQIYRGEESYFEESYAHGNLYSGWDNIWIEENNPDGGEVVQKSATVRKMPNDYRWFSNSSNINPRGDGKIETILSRRSLAETPQSVSPVKGEPSGRVLKRASPLKVSSSSTKIASNSVGDISLSSEPTSKKPKLIDAPNSKGDVSVGPEKTLIDASQTMVDVSVSSEPASKKSKSIDASHPMVDVSIDPEPASKKAEVKDASNSMIDTSISLEPTHKKTQLEDVNIKSEKIVSAETASISADKALPIANPKPLETHTLPSDDIAAVFEPVSTDIELVSSTTSYEHSKPIVATSLEATRTLHELKVDKLESKQSGSEKTSPSANDATKTIGTSDIETELITSSAHPTSSGNDTMSVTEQISNVNIDAQNAKADESATKSKTEVETQEAPSIPHVALPVEEAADVVSASASIPIDKPITKNLQKPLAPNSFPDDSKSTVEDTSSVKNAESHMNITPRKDGACREEDLQSEVQVHEQTSKTKSEPNNDQSASSKSTDKYKEEIPNVKGITSNKKSSITEEKATQQSSESLTKTTVAGDAGKGIVKLPPSTKKSGLRASELKQTATSDSDSEEDVTLSQIVKMKSQATSATKPSVSQTKSTKSRGTRSSSRIRKTAR